MIESNSCIIKLLANLLIRLKMSTYLLIEIKGYVCATRGFYTTNFHLRGKKRNHLLIPTYLFDRKLKFFLSFFFFIIARVPRARKPTWNQTLIQALREIPIYTEDNTNKREHHLCMVWTYQPKVKP